MDQFRQGLRNDVKDLLLTFPEDPMSLTEAISRAVWCDNRLFERRSERQQMLWRQPEQTYAFVVATPPQVSRPITRDDQTLMEIESTQHRGPLSDAEKQRRWAHRLCLYCGGPGHVAVNCPHKPRHQVYQVSTHENPTSSSIITSNNISKPHSPCHENRFDVLSQLDDVLNESVRPK